MDVALFEWDDFSPDAVALVSSSAVLVGTLRRSWAGRLAVFDLETTGIDVTTSRIVTAHVGILDESGACVESRDWLADPGLEIPAAASAVHGVTTERARRHGRAASQVTAEVVDALRSALERGLPLVVYNAPYDLSLLHHEALRHGVPPIECPAPVVDPLVLDRQVDRYRPGKRTLTATAAHYGVDLVDAHEASSDAIAAGRVAQAIAGRYPEVRELDAFELHERQIDWYREHAIDFQAYMRRERDPVFRARTLWPVA